MYQQIILELFIGYYKEEFEAPVSNRLTAEDIVRFISYEDDPVTANRQNVTFRFGVNVTDHTIEDLSEFSHKGNEKDEVGKIAWIPLNDIDKYQWAFNHKTRIVEIAHELRLI